MPGVPRAVDVTTGARCLKYAATLDSRGGGRLRKRPLLEGSSTSRDAGAHPWRRRIGLAVGLWLAYAANGREMGAGDTQPALLQPIAVARGDGLALDRLAPAIRAADPVAAAPGGFPPYYASIRRGRLVSRYPAARARRRPPPTRVRHRRLVVAARTKFAAPA